MTMKIIIINEHIGIRQFFTCQNFPNPGSSKFSTVKICAIRYLPTVFCINKLAHMQTDQEDRNACS